MNNTNHQNQINKIEIKVNPPPSTGTFYSSPDGQVEIVIKTDRPKNSPLRPLRYPQSKPPCVSLLLRPKSNSRIQQLPDGSIDLLLNNAELGKYVAALISLDPKFQLPSEKTARARIQRTRKAMEEISSHSPEKFEKPS